MMMPGAIWKSCEPVARDLHCEASIMMMTPGVIRKSCGPVARDPHYQLLSHMMKNVCCVFLWWIADKGLVALGPALATAMGLSVEASNASDHDGRFLMKLEEVLLWRVVWCVEYLALSNVKKLLCRGKLAEKTSTSSSLGMDERPANANSSSRGSPVARGAIMVRGKTGAFAM